MKFNAIPPMAPPAMAAVLELPPTSVGDLSLEEGVEDALEENVDDTLGVGEEYVLEEDVEDALE
jgi:hypothetical protein